MIEVSELKKLDVFGALSQKQLEEVAKITEKRTYKANAHIYEHGDPAKYLFGVMQGLVTLRELSPDDPVGTTFETREKGELFGAASLTEAKSYTLTAVCLKDSEILAIDADRLLAFFGIEPELGYRLMQRIAQLYFERYKVAKRQIQEMAKGPAVITAG